jgi:probable rRNA maturation factor
VALGTVEGDVVVLLTDDAAVQEINARFRDRDQPTNVLSFPAAESAAPHLGDLVLAHGVCAAEAAAQGKTLADHLTHLTVHGVLHLLGRDHVDEAEAEAMEAEERTLLASLGVADPYRPHDPAYGDA